LEFLTERNITCPPQIFFCHCLPISVISGSNHWLIQR